MFHSITFGDKNTWDDWHLIPVTRPVIAPPQVRSKYVEIPGMDGAYDLTEWLSGRVNYQNRSGTIDFAVENDHMPWHVLYSTILNYLHGKRMHVILEDDPEYYYDGRMTVNTWKSDKWYSTIAIGYTMDPWKYRVGSTKERWKWDPFNFYTGVIQNFEAYQVSGSASVMLYGYAMPAPIKFTCTSPMTMTFSGRTYNLPAGESILEGIGLKEGPNILVFNGNGTIGIDYRGGSL